ncbi:hypothetical protein GUITHDRAFT_145032 [Guillardia theta CCMP2712]|uniref:Uncharacterized protein n=1 Tax=Guillardia theta (strain CCMP2712) TaxID=905079 RepID=L1INF5_GUITC|nr:hypothetical protein GUITHDRAFT_145032 [Guillardia theta CCMP2712]EKX37330.1 hypothetical protein GUITHDRAFT_145032 [Guillardia theta CCMP2712]|eukprot:XP_005824310.1 hypothetical protein GUITHDRAFT_145032 [Guillardia theta CCMP2712]
MKADEDAMLRLSHRVKKKFLRIADDGSKGGKRSVEAAASGVAARRQWKQSSLTIDEGPDTTRALEEGDGEGAGDEVDGDDDSRAASRIRLFLRRLSKVSETDSLSICTDQDELNEMGTYSQKGNLPKIQTSTPSRHLQKYSESPVCPNSTFIVPTNMQAFGKNFQKRKSRFLGSEDPKIVDDVLEADHSLEGLVEGEDDEDEGEEEEEEEEENERGDDKDKDNVTGEKGEGASLRQGRKYEAATANTLTDHNPMFKSHKNLQRAPNSPIFSLDEEKEVLERVKRLDLTNTKMSRKIARLALAKDQDQVVHRADIRIGEVIRGEVGNFPQVCVFRLSFSRSSHLNTLRNKKAVRETLSSVRRTLASSHAPRVSKAPSSCRTSTPRVSETLEKLFRAAGVVDNSEDEELAAWTERGNGDDKQ